MQHIHAEFGFEIGSVLSGNSSVTLRYTRDKSTLPWQPILGLKFLQMIYTSYCENMITYNSRFSWSANPKKTFVIARFERTLPWQPSFGQYRPKNHKNGHNFSCMQHIHAEFGFEIGSVLSGTSSVTVRYTRDAHYHGNQFWDENCYKCISTRYSENVITYNSRFSWSANPKKTFLIGRF